MSKHKWESPMEVKHEYVTLTCSTVPCAMLKSALMQSIEEEDSRGERAMGKDLTIVPQDYIVRHIKTDDMLIRTKDGDYVCYVETERIPLIRCGECKHRNNREKCPMRVFTSDNGFCSCGEKE